MRLAALALLLAAPATAQVAGSTPVGNPAPKTAPTPKPVKVVTRSERLVTARTSDGGTRSYNCKAPQNAKAAVCRKH